MTDSGALAALANVAEKSEKFDLRITVQLQSGAQTTFRVTSRSVWFLANQLGHDNQLYRDKFTEALEAVLAEAKFEQQKVALKALSIKTVKSPVPTKEVRKIAIKGISDAFGIEAPEEEAVSDKVDTIKTVLVDQRQEIINELRSGEEGLRRWEKRAGAPSPIKHLQDADLSKLDLSGVNLHQKLLFTYDGSTFEGSDLRDSRLDHCSFKSCNFRNAIMDGASVQEATFEGGDLSGASFRKADLRGANFAKAKLVSADFTKAEMHFSYLCGADLSSAKLDEAFFYSCAYDETTKFPPGLAAKIPEQGLHWVGKGKDLLLIEKIKALSGEGEMTFDTFVHRLNSNYDQERMKKAMKMLQAESFQLFAEVKPDSLVGVVKSQSDPDLVYSCRLTEAGNFCCGTQNLNACGGLRGSLCKHILVLLIGITKSKDLDPAVACAWVMASRREAPKMDKVIISETFLRYKGAEAGEIDWRPTETIPEDYYAY